MPKTPTWLRAAELNATHIGKIIRFETDLRPGHGDPETAVMAVVTVELRQIGHNAGETHLTVGVGAETEFALTPDHTVVLNPADDYGDWDMFTAADLRKVDRHEEFHLDLNDSED